VRGMQGLSVDKRAVTTTNKDAVGPASQSARAIEALLLKQADDWNRGDLKAFARGYKDAPDILFMGSTIRQGYADMLAGYQKRYPTTKQMGRLTFGALAVQPLDARFATATGMFHLERGKDAGGEASGYFLLVLEMTANGWKIIRDDTTATSPLPQCAQVSDGADVARHR
jgi:ketosteroid isomerase-like protein